MSLDDPNDDSLARLNRQGFLPAASEDEAGYRARARDLVAWSARLRDTPLEIAGFGSLRPEDRLDEAELVRLGGPARARYGILPAWVPAYYRDRGLPWLTGGMAVSLEEGPENSARTFFQFKSVYRTRPRWWLYSAEEIASHEMCHVARAPLMSRRYEESIAYGLSASALRRWLGGALVHPRDGTLILGGLAWMIACDLTRLFFDAGPELAFSIIGKGPILLLIALGLTRNLRLRGELARCRRVLARFFGPRSEEVLFRLADEEIQALARLDPREFPTWWSGRPDFRGTWLRSLYPLDSPPPA